ARPGSTEGEAQPSASPSTAETPSSPSTLHLDAGSVPCPVQEGNHLRPSGACRTICGIGSPCCCRSKNSCRRGCRTRRPPSPRPFGGQSLGDVRSKPKAQRSRRAAQKECPASWLQPRTGPRVKWQHDLGLRPRAPPLG